MFNPDEVTRILAALDGKPLLADDKPIAGVADVRMKAMVLLGLNCGFGNTDVATLPQSALDLAGGWIDFPRPKNWHPSTNPALAGDRRGRSRGDCRTSEGQEAGGRFLTDDFRAENSNVLWESLAPE
jgi:hypothetical protein